METIQPRLIAHAAMAVRDDFIDDRLSADAGKRRFARRVNVGHDDAVGVIESAPELAPQRLGPRIAMRLKHGQNAITSGGFRGRERRANLGGMMRVIVHEQEAIALVLDFKTPPGVLEAAERSDDFLKRNSQLRGEGDHPERVAHIVAARNVQDGFAQFLAAAKNTEDRREILKIDIRAAIIRLRGKTEGDGTRARAANSPGVRIVRAIKGRSGGLIEQL